MTQHDLTGLGWSDHFARQIPPDTDLRIARIAEVARDHVATVGPDGPLRLVTPDETGLYAVGDFVLHDGTRIDTRLDRVTEIARKAAGPQAGRQLIAANVDTLGIVTSCNADFNPARLERYLAICSAGGALPLIILTKADLAADAEGYQHRAQRMSPLATAIAINACDPEDVTRLEDIDAVIKGGVPVDTMTPWALQPKD